MKALKIRQLESSPCRLRECTETEAEEMLMI